MGWDGASKSAFQLYKGIWQLGSLFPIGTNVYNREWDILIVLDACRVDLMKEVVSEYDCFDRVDSIYSVGSHSAEWMENTFSDEYLEDINKTEYITANPHSRSALPLPMSEFKAADEVWRYGFDTGLGTIPPRIITDQTINASREGETEQVIAHYMQPHQPFIAGEEVFPGESMLMDEVTEDAGQDGEWSPGDIGRHNIWRMCRQGEISRSELWAPYRENLRLVLDEIVLVLNNVDAKVVVTADHGNAIGEWGMYGHPAGCLLPAVRKVPWIEATGTDTREYEPDDHSQSDERNDTDEILKSLGYLN
jgi:hypothetical protein